jgi:microcystin-dependent protein
MFGFNFNPRGWAFCSGATIPIQQNTALFSLLGTQYGGNGTTTFQLPNFSGRPGCSLGQGVGLTPRVIGETFGVNTVTLTNSEVPSHGHGTNAYSPTVSGSSVGTPVANGGLSLLTASTTSKTFINTPLNTTLAPNMLLPSNGGNQPHQNQQPYLAVNFCIALQGIFPSFN